jgi:hypothetical protein
MASSANVLGGVFSPGQWIDMSSTPLGIGASVSGAVVDVTGVASATAFSNAAAAGVAELRGSAIADVVGTLWLETGKSEATLKKVKKVTLAQEAGGEFYGEIIHKPSTRFARFTFINGGGAQTAFQLQMFRLANL